MIISDENTNSPNKMAQEHTDGLPSYDMATSEVHSPGPYVADGKTQAQDVKVPPKPVVKENAAGAPPVGPSFIPPSMPPTTVYNYVNPVTHEHVVSLLPPNHPQMICLQEGRHVTETKYGLLGILAAIFWFPLGIGLCLLDRKVKCTRCGMILDEGYCG
ncbi:Membrane protein BRI3 [Abortiporus biennis]